MSLSAPPEILGVNIARDINGPLWQGLQKTFGLECRMSIYTRPGNLEHPRMRPTKSRLGRNFEVIVFDFGKVWQDLSAEDVLGLEVVPEWFEEDVLAVLSGAAILVLAPAKLLPGIRAAFQPYIRHRTSAFREREPSLWRQGGVHPAVDILRLWGGARSSYYQGGPRSWLARFAPLE